MGRLCGGPAGNSLRKRERHSLDRRAGGQYDRGNVTNAHTLHDQLQCVPSGQLQGSGDFPSLIGVATRHTPEEIANDHSQWQRPNACIFQFFGRAGRVTRRVSDERWRSGGRARAWSCGAGRASAGASGWRRAGSRTRPEKRRRLAPRLAAGKQVNRRQVLEVVVAEAETLAGLPRAQRCSRPGLIDSRVTRNSTIPMDIRQWCRRGARSTRSI